MHTIVIAYGPASVTRAAVDRARAWAPPGTTIDIVAPSTFSEAIGDDASPVGTVAVRRLAASLGTEPVLLVHDDAVVDTATVAAMRNAVESGVLVVPSADVPVFTCVAATGQTIADLTGPLVIPGTDLTAASVPCKVIGDRLDHDASCEDRLLADTPEPDRPLLVASMIVRDEEVHLPAALESLTGLVDRIDVCDTGSKDRTREVCRHAGASLCEIEWRDDFAWARNRALEMSRDAEYALFLDADERIIADDPARVRRWLRTWAHEVDAVAIRIDNDRDAEGVADHFLANRIARASSARFEGAIHEIVHVDAPDGTPGRVAVLPGASIDHVGYRSDVVDAKAKNRRNITIARAAYDREHTLKTSIDLARALLDADPGDAEAEELFEHAAALLTDGDPAPLRSMVHAARAERAFRTGELERSVQLAATALSATPNESGALAVIGEALLRLDLPGDLVELHAELSSRPPGTPIFVAQRNHARYRAAVGAALIQTGDLQSGLAILTETMAEDAAGTADLVAAGIAPAISAGCAADDLVPILMHDVTGQVAAALAGVAAPAETSRVCLAALDGGATHAPLVVMQLSAALITGADALAAAGLPHIGLVDAPTRAKVADLARRKGRHDLAERLAS